MTLLQEFKPALTFLSKFLILYFVGNMLYGAYVEAHETEADRVTFLVTAQTSWVLNRLGYETTYENTMNDLPKVALMQAGDIVLNVYEGCNGINVMIVFIAFLFAFGGTLRNLAIFIPVGLFVIHFFNLMRIGFLFYLALNDMPRFYYYHKYLFTATLYVIVFGLWAFWLWRFNRNRETEVAA